jgi:hypothetical protein
VEYYAHLFNVDTAEVSKRILASMVPTMNFVETYRGNPDLYGPFWIPTTVIFAFFVMSSIGGTVEAYLAGNNYIYDFRNLSYSVGIIYGYVGLMAVSLFLTSKYFGDAVTLIDALCIVGYSLSIWILAAVRVCF